MGELNEVSIRLFGDIGSGSRSEVRGGTWRLTRVTGFYPVGDSGALPSPGSSQFDSTTALTLEGPLSSVQISVVMC